MSISIQVGVSKIYSSWRRLHRGGGADNNDFLAEWTDAENCSELCFYGMRFDGLTDFWYDTPPYNGDTDPYYLKCTQGTAATPANGLRIQTASQLNTWDIDPLVPQMNVTDWLACMRMVFSLVSN